MEYSTTNGDDGLIIGTDDDDTYYVSLGNDVFDGGQGFDTVWLESSDAMLIRGVDTNGTFTGENGRKFIYIKVKDGENFSNTYTIAYNVEFIEFDNDNGVNLILLNSTNFFQLNTSVISDLSLKNDESASLDLSNHFFSYNEGNNISYTISSSNPKISDQIVLDNNKLEIISGNSGPLENAVVKILASETSINTNKDNIKELSFTVSMSDDDYHPYFSSFVDPDKTQVSPINESMNSGTLNYSNQNDIIVLAGGADTELGRQGDDIYLISDLIPVNSDISIIDNFGSNKIQFPDNTFISSALFTKDALRIVLSDSKTITINGADNFTFNLGANITSGDTSDDLDFITFASWFGVEDVLNLTSSVEASISDVYIV